MKRIAAAIALGLFLAFGAIGVTASPPGVQSHWVNFATGYANSWGTFGDAAVSLQGVSGYQPESIRFIVDDNGYSEVLHISWSEQCWDESGILVQNVDDIFTNPNNFTKQFSVPVPSDRCELGVLAMHNEDGFDGHVSVTFQAQYNH